MRFRGRNIYGRGQSSVNRDGEHNSVGVVDQRIGRNYETFMVEEPLEVEKLSQEEDVVGHQWFVLDVMYKDIRPLSGQKNCMV